MVIEDECMCAWSTPILEKEVQLHWNMKNDDMPRFFVCLLVFKVIGVVFRVTSVYLKP